MASDLEFVQYVCEQASQQWNVTSRLMFGDYTLYCQGKVVGLVCDNQLFVKPTDAGKDYLGSFEEAPAYPGAKPSLLIQDQIDDGPWLSKLIAITVEALPKPRPKKPRKPKK